jgi:exosortase
MKTADDAKRKKRRRRPAGKNQESPNDQRSGYGDQASGEVSPRGPSATWIGAGAVLAIAFTWSYWPTLVKLVDAWNRQPDYSHGYFVVPLALLFLWARREKFPGWPDRMAWPGLILIALSIAVRMSGARYYVDAIDAWSILFWVAGVVWLLGGWRVLRWSLPSIVFLWFMIPLPFRAERWLSLPLQRVATKLSCWTLQTFGEPALAEGNTILIRDFRLEVAQACSGLRIFVGIVALAFAYLVLVRRTWWEKVLLIVSIGPIAIIANATRIVVTALLSQWASDEAAQKFTHDFSGWVMIPFAAGLFALVLWYVGKLVREVEQIDVGDVVRGETV